MKKCKKIIILSFLLVGTACGNSSESSSSSDSIDVLEAREILENVIDLRGGSGLTYSIEQVTTQDASLYYEIGNQYSQLNTTVYKKKYFTTDLKGNFEELNVFYKIYNQDDPQIKQSYDGQLVTTEKTDDQSYHCRQFSVDENNVLNLSRDETLSLEEMEVLFFPKQGRLIANYDANPIAMLKMDNLEYLDGYTYQEDQYTFRFKSVAFYAYSNTQDENFSYTDTIIFTIKVSPYAEKSYISEFNAEVERKPLLTYYQNEITDSNYVYTRISVTEQITPNYQSLL